MSDAADLLAKHANPVTAARAHADELEHQRSQEFRQRMADRRAGKKTRPPVLAPPPKPEVAGQTILAIGDPHAHPDFSNARFDMLGRAITDIQPDIVWEAGDWFDLPSLCYWDASTKAFEGRRYWLDIEAGIDAQERVEAQLADWNRGRKTKLSPRFVRTLGNHEARIGKLLQQEPRWSEFVGYHDLCSAEFGWEEHPFGEVVDLCGIAVCHQFPSGVKDQPIGGENPAKTTLHKHHMSCLAGHSHVKDYAERNNAVGKRVQAMQIGCFFDYEMEWTSKRINQMYARGLLVLRDVKDGSFDFEWIGMDAVRRRYS